MKVEKTGDEIIVEKEGEKLSYSKDEWGSEENVLTSSGVLKFEEWKVDLLENHGVDLDELRS